MCQDAKELIHYYVITVSVHPKLGIIVLIVVGISQLNLMIMLFGLVKFGRSCLTVFQNITLRFSKTL